MTSVLILVPVAYLLGAFPAASLVARATGHDVLTEGSRNPGASNVYRLAGWKAGLVVFLADLGKGAVASAAGLVLDGHPGAYLLGLAAVVGHMLPATQRFKGGRGVATAAGVLLVLFPFIALALAVVWFVIARLLRKASVASIVVVVAFPVLVAVTSGTRLDIAVTIAMALAVLARHLPNVRRLLRGKELGIGDAANGDTVRGP